MTCGDITTSRVETRAREKLIPSQCLKAILISGKVGQATDIFIFHWSLSLPLGTFMFLYPDAQRFSVFLVARGIIQGSGLAASDNLKVEGVAVYSRTASQDASEGKFPFWVCCLKEFPMQADVNS